MFFVKMSEIRPVVKIMNGPVFDWSRFGNVQTRWRPKTPDKMVCLG